MAAIAQRAPSETILQFLDGTRQPLSHYRGRVVLLQILTTRCVRCVEIVRLLNELQRVHGIQPVAIAINLEARETIHDFIALCNPEFPVALDSKKSICELLGLPSDKPLYLPVIAFIDRGGAIRGLSAPGTDFFSNRETTFSSMIRRMEQDEQ